MSEYIAKCNEVVGISGKTLIVPDYIDTSEEIVRCMDCVHYYEAENYHPSGNYVRRCCKYFDTYDNEVEPYGFCAWGERREQCKPLIVKNADSYNLDTREHMDNGVSVQMSPNDTGAHSNVSQNLSDTREQLEADVKGYYSHTVSTLVWPPDKNKSTDVLMVPEDTVLSWLDRQAALDRKEFEMILKGIQECMRNGGR